MESTKEQQSIRGYMIFAAAVTLTLIGALTMSSFQQGNPFFIRQLIWLCISSVVFFAASQVDWRILRRTGVAVGIYGVATGLLLLLFVIGKTFLGADSWFSFGLFSFQPIELASLALIIVLAKYFSRRHIEIANIRHILVSGAYAFILFLIVALQPDFGGAIIIFCVWLCMVLVSGISRTHLLTVITIGAVAFAGLWSFGFHEYQRQRVLNFLHPLADVRGTGYNALQSTIAVGSGQLIGKGIGYGTQSKLRFLPEYQTDFMFAAFSEEWGFCGVLLLFVLYGVLFFLLLSIAVRGATNVEMLFVLGVLFYLAAHFILHVGINMGILPVTGTTIPFMSYGGSHLFIEFLMLGIVAGMDKYGNAAHRDMVKAEFSGGYDV